MRFALYGDEKIVERQREIVQDAFGTIPGAQVSSVDGTVEQGPGEELVTPPDGDPFRVEAVR